MRRSRTAISRCLAVALAVVLPLLAEFGVSAGVVRLLTAADPAHHFALRSCDSGTVDLVLAHDDGRADHAKHTMPMFERLSSEANAPHADHFLRCSGADSSTAPVRAPSAPKPEVASTAAISPVIASTPPRDDTARVSIPSTVLTSLRLTVLRI